MFIDRAIDALGKNTTHLRTRLVYVIDVYKHAARPSEPIRRLDQSNDSVVSEVELRNTHRDMRTRMIATNRVEARLRWRPRLEFDDGRLDASFARPYTTCTTTTVPQAYHLTLMRSTWHIGGGERKHRIASTFLPKTLAIVR